MKDSLNQFFFHFWRKCSLGNGPVLIAFSGGPDSRALFELFLSFRKLISNPIHLAHVDHGWREESSVEALRLKELAIKNNVSWHLKTLAKSDFIHGSDEDVARRLRYEFFSTVYKNIGAEGLFLGHQLDDLAETVLKRIFEGAGLSSLGGMQEDSFYNGMRVLRPLLSRSKQELISWLNTRGVDDYVVDSTNLSSKYLRGKMRSEIFPFLEKAFGKSITCSLASLSKESYQLKEANQEDFSPYLEKVQNTQVGFIIDKKDLKGLASGRMFHFLQYLFKRRGLSLSRSLIEQLAKAFSMGLFAKEYVFSGGKVCLEGDFLFAMVRPLPKFSPQHFDVGQFQDELWRVETKIDDLKIVKIGDARWIKALKGHLSLFPLEEGDRLVYFDEIQDQKTKQKILRRFSTKKVPVSLRTLFPFIIKRDEIVIDFLSDCNSLNNKSVLGNLLMICFVSKNN